MPRTDKFIVQGSDNLPRGMIDIQGINDSLGSLKDTYSATADWKGYKMDLSNIEIKKIEQEIKKLTERLSTAKTTNVIKRIEQAIERQNQMLQAHMRIVNGEEEINVFEQAGKDWKRMLVIDNNKPIYRSSNAGPSIEGQDKALDAFINNLKAKGHLEPLAGLNQQLGAGLIDTVNKNYQLDGKDFTAVMGTNEQIAFEKNGDSFSHTISRDYYHVMATQKEEAAGIFGFVVENNQLKALNNEEYTNFLAVLSNATAAPQDKNKLEEYNHLRDGFFKKYSPVLSVKAKQTANLAGFPEKKPHYLVEIEVSSKIPNLTYKGPEQGNASLIGDVQLRIKAHNLISKSHYKLINYVDSLKKEIPSNPHWNPLTFFKSDKQKKVLIAERLSTYLNWISEQPNLRADDVAKILRTVQQAIDGNKEAHGYFNFQNKGRFGNILEDIKQDINNLKNANVEAPHNPLENIQKSPLTIKPK
jgi:hypothetical protein